MQKVIGYYIQFSDETLAEAIGNSSSPFLTIDDAKAEAEALKENDGVAYEIIEAFIGYKPVLKG